MTKKTRNWLIISGILVVLVGGGVFAAMNKKPTVEYTTADVVRGNLVQTVNETGTITPAKEIELNFQNTGQLTSLAVKVGDTVMPDQVLGQIDYSGLAIKQQEALASLNVSQANVSQSEANLESAQREYDKLSASQKEVVAQAQKTQRDLEDRGAGTVTTQEQAIITAQKNLTTTQATYQRAVNNKTDALVVAMESKLASAVTSLAHVNRALTDRDIEPTLGASNSTALGQTRTGYTIGKEQVAKASAAVAAYKAASSEASLNAAYEAEQAALDSVFDVLGFLYTTLGYTPPSSSFSQDRIESYKTATDNQITVTANSITALQTAKQAVEDAHLALDTNTLTAQQNIDQAQTAYDNALRSARNAVATAMVNRDQQLAAAQTRIDSARANLSVVRAQVGQASANVQSVNNQIQNNILKSPIKGVITKINYEIGEQVSPTKALLSVLTENNFQIEVDIAETDISKVKLNDAAEITLDSLGESVKFQGKVYFVDPAQTVIQGVTYYKVKISFDPGGQPVKPGMTANAVITTAQREGVLIMPSRAVVEHDNTKFVRLLENGQPREVPITLGLSGDDGLIEVTNGIKEGDKVVTFVKDSSKK